MPSNIENAIDSLYSELDSLNKQVVAIKSHINSLSVSIGKDQPFKDAELSTIVNSQSIRHDQFFGKGLATAVKEYLKMKNGSATAKEIFDALKTGGFEFDTKTAENIQFRGLTISLSKNSNDFVYLKSSNSYGLWEFYPDKKKKRLADKLIDEKIEEKENESKKE